MEEERNLEGQPTPEQALCTKIGLFFWFCSIAVSLVMMVAAVAFALLKNLRHIAFEVAFLFVAFVVAFVVVFGVWKLIQCAERYAKIVRQNKKRADYISKSLLCFKNMWDAGVNVTILVVSVLHPITAHGAQHGIELGLGCGAASLVSTWVGGVLIQSPVDGLAVFSNAILSLLSFCIADKRWGMAIVTGLLYIFVASGLGVYYYLKQRRTNNAGRWELCLFYILYPVVFLVIMIVLGLCGGKLLKLHGA